MMNFSIFTKNLLEKNESQRSDSLSKVFESKFLTKARNKRITKPYQFFGIWIAQNLNDFENIPLYIKLAKEQDKFLLEHAISYVSDYPEARSKKRLFLWFLKGKLKKNGSPKSKKVSTALFAKPQSIKKIGNVKVVIPENSQNLSGIQESNNSTMDSLLRGNVDNENLSPIEIIAKTLHKEFSVKFEQDYYFSIYKVDLFCERMKLALDFTKDIQKNLARKQYFKSKKQKLNKSGIRYEEIKLSLKAAPTDEEIFKLIDLIRN